MISPEENLRIKLREALKDKLRETHRTLRVRILGDVQEVVARKTLTVEELLAQLVRRMSSDLDANDSYALFGRGTTPIPGATTLAELRDGELHMGKVRPALGGAYRVALVTDTGEEFPIEWQPALIGRTKQSAGSIADDLAVDLAQQESWRSVSGKHAQITEAGGHYYIENLTERSILEVNGVKIEPGQGAHELGKDDKIRVGKIILTLRLTPKA